jgi:exodeoxyribonuclease-1
MKQERQSSLVADENKVDAQLYDDFIPDEDKTKISVIRAAKPEELSDLHLDFIDERLKALLPLYKARNFPQVLTVGERQYWENFRRHRLVDGGATSRASRYFKRLEYLLGLADLPDDQRYVLEQLSLYGESVLPAD